MQLRKITNDVSLAMFEREVYGNMPHIEEVRKFISNFTSSKKEVTNEEVLILSWGLSAGTIDIKLVSEFVDLSKPGRPYTFMDLSKNSVCVKRYGTGSATDGEVVKYDSLADYVSTNQLEPKIIFAAV